MPRGYWKNRTDAWTSEMVSSLKLHYENRMGQQIKLREFAESIGKAHTNVCRKARSLGLTDNRRKRSDGSGARKPKFASKEELKNHLSKIRKEWYETHEHPRGSKGMKHSDASKGKMRNALIRWHETASKKEKKAAYMKAIRTKIGRYGTAGPAVRSTNAYSRARRGYRPDLGKIFFRSRWEANYARYLNFLKNSGAILDWKYEPDTFRFGELYRGVTTYTPDFKITEPDKSIIYHEVKGWMDNKSKTRLRRMKKYHPNVRLFVIDEKAYRKIEKTIGLSLPNWESKTTRELS